MLGGIFNGAVLDIVMFGETPLQIAGLADVTALGGYALDHMCMERHNSPSRVRTYDLAVNSRSLYRLSYRGIPIQQHRPASCAVRTIFVRFTWKHYPNSGFFVKRFFFHWKCEKSV